ncbi:MAG TPA: SAM-dependent methyltransferase [Opitutaceae bacterium]|nr:SAM-dependent methyltransferase [Opitutaceae bacterium]
MKPSTAPSADPAVLEALRRRARGAGALSFADFMDVALYEPGCGYYRRRAPRIGYAPGTDFLTASASAPLFGRLVAAACAGILGPSAADYEFVEIGAEPGAGVLRGVAHPFRSARQVEIGESPRIDGRCIVFSNELFDAQPFRRFRFRAGAWRELGVSVGAGALHEMELAAAAAPAAPLPEAAPEGYVIDAPFAAAALARRIAGQPWSGLFLAFDYGKSWQQIALETPAGTARAYRSHAQGNDLLELPGQQDLTCHVCWDWLADALRDLGFGEPRVESQESFFVRNSGEFLAALAQEQAGRLSRDKLSLQQLLHPAHLGHRFQALWALRRPAPAHGPGENHLA